MAEEKGKTNPDVTPEAGAASNQEVGKGKEGEAFLNIKFLQEEKVLSKEEAIELAQIGLNYRERVKDKYESLKTQVEQRKAQDAFLDSFLEEHGYSTFEDYQHDLEVQKIIDKEKLPRKAAEDVYEGRKARLEKQKADKQKADMAMFIKKYPDVKADTIPKSVWADYHAGTPLVAAYAVYEAEQIRKENEILKENMSNAKASTGSLKNKGSESREEGLLSEEQVRAMSTKEVYANYELVQKSRKSWKK